MLRKMFHLMVTGLLVALAAPCFGGSTTLEQDMETVDRFLEKAENIDAYMTGNASDEAYPQTPRAFAKRFCQAICNEDDQALFALVDPHILTEFSLGFQEQKAEKNSQKELEGWKAMGCEITQVQEHLETGGTYVTYANREKILVVKEEGRLVFTFEEDYRERLYEAMPPIPETSSGVAEAVCRTFRDKAWPEFLGYIDLSYLEEVKKMVLKIREDDYSGLSCKIQEAKELKDGVVRYHFDTLGNVDLKMDEGYWYVVKF